MIYYYYKVYTNDNTIRIEGFTNRYIIRLSKVYSEKDMQRYYQKDIQKYIQMDIQRYIQKDIQRYYQKDIQMTRQMKKQIDEISFYQISIILSLIQFLHAPVCFIKKKKYPMDTHF